VVVKVRATSFAEAGWIPAEPRGSPASAGSLRLVILCSDALQFDFVALDFGPAQRADFLASGAGQDQQAE